MNDSKPNILIILVDDMGYSDIGSFGSEIQTPNLDKLAADGLSYTHFYNTARCCPSRACLMTGLYPHQAGMGWMNTFDLGTDGYAGDLSPDCVTLAEALGANGYSTYMAGKWHLTRNEKSGPDGPKDAWPLQRGFEKFHGSLVGAGSYWSTKTMRKGNEPIEAPKDNFYYTDYISDHSCEYIKEHSKESADKPFFIYTAYTAPHWPLHAPAEDIARYRGKYRAGWEKLRAERYARQRKAGLLSEGWELSEPDSKVPSWDKLSPEEQDQADLRMAIYAAQVEIMDRGVGRIVETLKEEGQLDNTLIFFLSDNGGCAEECHRESPGGKEDWGTDASFESYGRPWANVSNTPFRLYKHWVHEGGVATPLIVHWPEGIKPRGSLESQAAHLTDIMATCLDVTGSSQRIPGKEKAPEVEGRSLAPSFQGGDNKRGAIFFEHEGNRALRDGKWKVVTDGLKKDWELYDLESDRPENHDLASKYPERVKEMVAQWEAMAEKYDVYPLFGSNAERWAASEKAQDGSLPESK